jgi:hypothetical protein
MPRVHQTKARIDGPKACPQAKAGEIYYWWRTRMKGAKSGVTRCSMTRPKPSQLTMSDFWSSVFLLQESMTGPYETSDDLEYAQDDWAQQARDIAQDQQDKLDNMPQQLQDGDTGQMIQDRVQACEDWADAIEAVEIPSEDDFDNEDDFLNALADALSEIENITVECS